MKQILFAIFLTCSSVLAQTAINHLVFPTGFSLESFSGYGYSKTINNQSNIASSNPASLNRYQSITLGMSYEFESDVKPGYIANIGTTRYNKSIPLSAGIVIPYNALRLGFGFTQKYNASLMFGDIPVTTVENPDGTGEIANINEKANVFRYSGLISYCFTNLFESKNKLNLGLAINYDRLNYYFSNGIIGQDPRTLIESHGSKMSYSLGVTYSFSNSANLNNLFSFFWEKSVDFDKMITDEYKDYLTWYMYSPRDMAVSREPEKFHLGFDHSFSEKSQLTTTLSYVGWGKRKNNWKDQLEAAASFIYSPKNNLFTSIGFFWTDQKYSTVQDDFFNLNGKYNSLFITAGVVFNYSMIDLDLVVADDHLFSGEYRKQTIGKVSLGFHL